MNTPICDFVKKYAQAKGARFHMPGHKGKELLGFEELDITEIDGADVLYSAQGVIAQSMENAASLFGTQKTLYSTQGSSLCINAMLYLTCLYAKALGKKAKIAAGRNAHRAFLASCALLDLEIDWLYGESLISCTISAECLENYFKSTPELPIALYITSPDYLGCMCDIFVLSAICEKYGILLLVDNAHGAYLKFLSEDKHPITLGAHLCCDSAHKTMSVLTGGAYLHISKSAPKLFAQRAKDAMSLFASSSPSYLILQSLDLNNLYLSGEYRQKLDAFVKNAEKTKKELSSFGFELVGDEPQKITIRTKPYGYTGEQIYSILKNSGIIAEFADRDFICFMLNEKNTQAELEALKSALCAIPKKEEIKEKYPQISKAERYCCVKQALMCDTEIVSVDESEGRVFASLSVSCPPAIPIVVCGEIIDFAAIERMKYYGIERIRVKK